MSMEVVRRSTVAILYKQGVYAAIAMAITDEHNFVSNYDPRSQPHNYSRSFETEDHARTAFNESVATSRDRGFAIVYHGPRNFG